MAEPAPAAIDPTVTNIFGLSQYDGQTEFFSSSNYLLPQAAGWGIVLGFGAFFALFAVLLVWLDIRFSKAKYHSEQFNTAGRTIGVGLLAVDLVSHWTWASILLQSVSYGWLYGAAGSMYYAVNDCLIIWLFAIMALELKHRAPKAHTILELVKIRWGTLAHWVFFAFAVFTNLLVSISMLQGCVSVTNALTGVNPYAMSFVIPAGVILYVAIGGLKATFTTAYIHTAIIYVVCCVFMFKVYASDGLLGSIDLVYERLKEAAIYFPVPGNRGGSYLTGFSEGGVEFSAIFFLSALAQMFVDQAYWQSAVAARPKAAVKGYFLGAFLFLAIVFALPACLGLAAVALSLPVSLTEALNGLVMPASAYVLLGKAGPILVLIICYMAVTSSGASEMVAVSSLFTFDIYREYINKQASGERLLMVSRISVCIWAVIMGCASCIVQAASINVNWLIIVIGVFVGGAVPPVAMALLWDRCTRKAAISASLLGNCVSLGVSLLVAVVVSLVFPDEKPFDWNLYKTNIKLSEDTDPYDATTEGIAEAEESAAELARMRKPVAFICVAGCIIGLFVWPLLTLPAGTPWSLGYFRFWIVLTMIILLIGSAVAILLPVWEAKEMLGRICKYLLGRGLPPAAKPYPMYEDSAHGSKFAEPEKKILV
ncbi:hypothetical protein WJX72_001008 [[Myrmecia] bisecta]|uniref:Uncharacterized protein n=1 Tax=[Myrmecia] bisecta TaxID=41462 RepID=A0AAW1Q2S2_9CHLO